MMASESKSAKNLIGQLVRRFFKKVSRTRIETRNLQHMSSGILDYATRPRSCHHKFLYINSINVIDYIS